VRTIFNILGPMTNPGRVRRQLVGTFNTALAAKLSAVLLHLGAIKALAVHSEDGMDEISIASPTTVFEGSASDGVKERRIGPEDFGLTPGSPESMAGGTAEENARMALSILRGEDVPGRDVVLLNAAAGIYVAGKTGTFDDAAQRAKESINTGNAYRTLTRLAEFSNRS
jgi:anthranilate phosphoribosyltransferase